MAAVRFAYADPPYIGQARKHYGADPLCAEVDHAALIQSMAQYDGWALSASSTTLHLILPLCPEGYRIGAWVKPWCSFKPNVNPAYAWEPVIFYSGRKLGRKVLTVRDWVSANVTLQRGVHGAKPDTFCVWLFNMLGMRLGDELIDLFPGSGAVTAMWQRWCNMLRMEKI